MSATEGSLRRTLDVAEAHCGAWAFAGAGGVLAQACSPSALSLPDRVQVAAYQLGQAFALGVATWLAVSSWRRWGTPHLPRWTSRVALAAAAFAVSCAVLAEDLESFAARNSESVAWLWVPSFSLGAALGLSAAAALRPRGRLSWAVAVVGAVLGVGHAWVLPLLYPGAHLIAAWAGVLLVGQSLAGAWPSTPVPRRWVRVGRVVCGLATLTVLVPPPAVVRVELLHRSGAVIAPYVSRLWATPLWAAVPWPTMPESAVGAGAPLSDSPWFRSRRDAPPVAARPLAFLPRPPIVVVVTVDALRADVLAKKSAAKRFPALDALARRSVRFSRVWAPSPGTYPSMGSLFLGTYRFQQHWVPSPRSKTRQEYPNEDPSPRVPELLAAAGVDPWLVASHGGLRGKWGIGRGFTREVAMEYWPKASDVVSRLISQLEKHRAGRAERPLLLFTHVLEPHAPYDRGEREGSAFRRYLSEVRVVDEQIARLVTAIDASAEADRTVLVVSADHGEAFGEHGAHYHRTTVYDEMVRVPLLLYVPGATPRVVDEPVTLLDLPPTLLDLFGVETPGHFMGQSLLGFVRGDTPRLRRPIFVDSRVGAHAMVFPDGKKAIVRPEQGTHELYDLDVDRDERVNRASQPGSEAYFGALETFMRVHARRPH